ncbi:MAG: hypothetical protein RSF90_00270, partial [Pygmaiobacter sp.]
VTICAYCYLSFVFTPTALISARFSAFSERHKKGFATLLRLLFLRIAIEALFSHRLPLSILWAHLPTLDAGGTLDGH